MTSDIARPPRRGRAGACVALAAAWVALLARAPSAAEPGGAFIDSLQGNDASFYEGELLDLSPAIAESSLARLDSLGYEAFADSAASRESASLGFGLANELITYNRVEGFVAGLGATGRFGRRAGGALRLQAAYATGSEQLRYFGALGLRTPRERRRYEIEVGFTDRVIPFGSNRPTANAIRALVGSADEQDYLRSRGGWAGVKASRSKLGEIGVRYEASRIFSVSPSTDFSLFGDPQRLATNPIVDEGIERAAVVHGEIGSTMRSGASLAASHRIAGGGLGGDFGFTRFDASLDARRYLFASWEAVGSVAFARSSQSAPIQWLADIGGESSVRGFDRRVRTALGSLRGRLEILLPYDPLRALDIPILRDAAIQIVPWVDAGRIWDPVPAPTDSTDPEEWLSSTGLGLQRYLGPFGSGSYLRLDLAAPLGPDRPEDFRAYLGFAAGYF